MRVFVCQAVPNELMQKYHVSQAASTFCFDLIDNECFDYSLSLLPINIKQNVKARCEHYKTDFIQCRFFPHKGILKILNNIIENIIIIRKTRKYEAIWFYNIVESNLLSVFILRNLFFKKVYAIVADYNPPSKKLSLNYVFKKVIYSLHGIITLSLRGDLSHRNQDCVAGIIPSDRINLKMKRTEKITFLFSGILNAVKGIDMVVDVFKEIPEAKLIISGRGDKRLTDSVKDSSNISYLGFLTQEEYRSILNDVTYCLNFRNPNFPENFNNFPSKVLEYFLYNKAVISTIEYPELNDFKYYYVPFNKGKIITLIRELIAGRIDHNEVYFNHKEKLKQNFSEEKWKKVMNQIENQI